MAGYVKHGTLAGGTAISSVSLTEGAKALKVLNRNGTGEIYYTVACGGGTPADPSIGGDDCFVVAAAVGAFSAEFISEDPGINVKLTGGTTTSFSVTAQDLF